MPAFDPKLVFGDCKYEKTQSYRRRNVRNAPISFIDVSASQSRTVSEG